MHKHSIEDYKNVIDAELTEEDGKITDSRKFEKVYSKQFYSMFEHIAEEFQWRLKDLKSELEKRLDIRYKNESDNESEDESDNESEDESKLPPFITIGKYKLSENSPLKNLSEAELDEKFKKVGSIRGFKDVESTEENEVDNKSESKFNQRGLHRLTNEDLKTLSKLKPGDKFKGMTYGGPYNPKLHPKWKI